MKKLFVCKDMSRAACVAIIAFAILSVTALPSCKAWRTITTTSTYTAANDSAKSTITIQSKTVEVYLILSLVMDFEFVKFEDYCDNVVCKFICESTLAE